MPGRSSSVSSAPTLSGKQRSRKRNLGRFTLRSAALVGCSFEDVVGEVLAEGVGGLAVEMDILAGPPIGVEAIFVVFDELPLVADGDFRVAGDDFGGPWVEVFFHDAGGASRGLVVSSEVAGGREAVGDGAGGDPDEFGAGFFEFGDDFFEAFLVAGFFPAGVPVAVVEADDVPVPAGLVVGAEPVDDILGAVRGGAAVGGRVVEIEFSFKGISQAVGVVAGNGIADEEVAGQVGIIVSGLIADGLHADFLGDNDVVFLFSDHGGFIDEGVEVCDSENAVEGDGGLTAFF